MKFKFILPDNDYNLIVFYRNRWATFIQSTAFSILIPKPSTPSFFRLMFQVPSHLIMLQMSAHPHPSPNKPESLSPSSSQLWTPWKACRPWKASQGSRKSLKKKRHQAKVKIKALDGGIKIKTAILYLASSKDSLNNFNRPKAC